MKERTCVGDTILLTCLHGALRFGQFCRRNHFHGLQVIYEFLAYNRIYQEHTFVIFSMFLTDLRRSSISRRVAMLRAWEGAAPSTWGWDAMRPSVRRASMVWYEKKGMEVVVGAVDVDTGKWRDAFGRSTNISESGKGMRYVSVGACMTCASARVICRLIKSAGSSHFFDFYTPSHLLPF